MDPAIRSDFDDPVMEEDMEEGTCGYGKDGKIGKKPAGPDMLQERFQQLAGIKSLYEQGFDDRLKAAGGFSDEEFDDITSRDVGSPFPGEHLPPGTNDARDMIDKIKDMYRQNDDQWMDDFIKEMVGHFMETTQGIEAAKVAMINKKI